MGPRPVRCFALALLASALVRAQAPDADTIVRRSLDRDWTDFTTQRDYVYQQRSEFRDFDRSGMVKNRRSETREIQILFGRRYERKIARNDHPLSPVEERKEQEKLDREAAKRSRETANDRARWEKQRAEDRAFVRELPDAFTFLLTGSETISGQPAWVLEAEPKPGFRPKHSRADMFKKVRAKIWIEQATYHWVKMEALVLDTLSFGLGLFRVAPGTTMFFEQLRVNDEIWLPSSIKIRGDARLALLKKVRAEMDLTYSGYRKFQGDSRIVETAP
ncbi:MAG: hypothetical protein ABL967_00895 [Bryobacteraceae bacterium]